MSLINFTAEFNVFKCGNDWSDIGDDADETPLNGWMTFVPQMEGDGFVVTADYDPPAGILTDSIFGYVENGELKATKGGPVGVRLPANDPVLQLADPWVYRVKFDLRTPAGRPVKISDRFLLAPTSDVTVQLAEVLASSLSSAAAAPRLSGGSFSGGTVTFENEDGSVLAPISIPGGVVVFVDNGDSTWSVG